MISLFNMFISIENLKKSFTMGTEELDVLRDINFSVNKGEMLGIVGMSGVGKSTLLYILGALDRPTSGSVYFEGDDIFRYTNSKISEFRNSKIGFVFQFNQLLPELTALENTLMPALIGRVNKKEALCRAERLLHEVGIGDRLGHKPGELSGGEQQRVAIARALMNNPMVVLADEPTGNLDKKTGDCISSLMRSLNKEFHQTFIVVTHNDRLAESMDRVIKIDDGTAIE